MLDESIVRYLIQEDQGVPAVLYTFISEFSVLSTYCFGKKKHKVGVETDPVVLPTNKFSFKFIV